MPLWRAGSVRSLLLTLAGLTYTPKRQQSCNESIKLDPRSDNASDPCNERSPGCGSEYGRVIVWEWACVFVWA